MWDIIWNIGLIIVGLTVGAIFLTLLLANYLRSKVLCLVSGGIALYFGSLMKATDMAAEGGDYIFNLLWAVLFTTLAWLFFVGPSVLDEYWDGSWNIIEHSDSYEVSENTSGGLIAHFMGAVAVIFCLYFFLGEEYDGMVYIVPMIVMGLNILGFLKNLIFNRE